MGYRRGVGRLLFLAVMSGLFLLTFFAVLMLAQRLAGPRPRPLPDLAAQRARELEQARWKAAHYELDGVTHVVVQKTVPGVTGDPEVVDRREVRTVHPDDPHWEATFTDAMADARVRAEYLNAEESAG